MTPMNKDQLQQWALIGEVVGALAVVISLLFVAFQIKQGTAAAEQTSSAIQMDAYQSLIENIITINIHQMESAELSSVFLKIHDAPESLTPKEELHFMVYMLTLFRHGDTSFFHYQNGAIDEVRLHSLLVIMTGKLESIPKARELWEENKSQFDSDYVAFVDGLLESSSAPPEQAHPAGEA